MPRWTAQGEAALLMAIIEAADIKVRSNSMQKVVEIMGDGYSLRGVEQHWTLMKKRRDEGGIHNTAVQVGAAPEAKIATPRKRKATSEMAAPTKKPKIDIAEHDKDDDETLGMDEKLACKHEDGKLVVKAEAIEQDEAPI